MKKKTLRCNKCSTSFYDPVMLEVHKRKEHPSLIDPEVKVECPDCHKSIALKSLKKHLRQVHGGPLPEKYELMLNSVGAKIDPVNYKGITSNKNGSKDAELPMEPENGISEDIYAKKMTVQGGGIETSRRRH